MSNFFEKRLKNEKDGNIINSGVDYIFLKGDLNELKIKEVNHVCIMDDCVVFNNLTILFGEQHILENDFAVLDDILHELVPELNRKENKNKDIFICGNKISRTALGRKLEDRLKKEINY